MNTSGRMDVVAVVIGEVWTTIDKEKSDLF